MNAKFYTRRQFLKSSFFGGAGLLIASNMFARTCLAPNGKINLAIIGCGKMADGHIGGLIHSPLCKIIAVCDVDSARTEYQKRRIESEYKKRGDAAPDVKEYKDFRELLANPSVDAVLIATPDHWHAIPAICAVNAGKAVYCEKPLTFTVEEGRKLVNAAKRMGVPFQVGSQQRSSAEFKRAAQLARNKYLGEIKEVYVSVSAGNATPRNWKIEECPSTVDWDFWCGPAPYNPYSSQLLPKIDPKASKPHEAYGWNSWRHHLDYGNGSQADWGAHQFDIALWGLVLDGKGIKYIELTDKEDMPGEKHWRMYRYLTESGIPIYRGNHPAIPKRLHGGLTFVCEKGLISAARGHFWSDREALETAKLRDDDVSLISSEAHKENFLNAVLKGTPLAAPVEVGHSTGTLCIIGNIAYNLGRSLEWDWKSEKFVNDAEACKFLSRPNRGEWAAY